MPNWIEQEVAAMRKMMVAELRNRYGELFGEPPRCRNKEHLIRRIAWRLQALGEGGLSDRARHRAAELAADADLRIRPRKEAQAEAGVSPPPLRKPDRRDKRLPIPGTILTRQYKHETIQVKTLEKGFEYDGQRFLTLTAVARAVTGTHWNGFHFFGFRTKG